MTLDKIRSAIEAIKNVADDDEKAHSREDVLHQSVLSAIAEGKCDDPVEASRLALTTLDISFSRWCA